MLTERLAYERSAGEVAQGARVGMLADSQAIKPGNRMPAYTTLSGDELQAVAAYLDGLE